MSRIAAITLIAGSLLYSNYAMAMENSECRGISNYLRGGRTVEMTIGNEIILVKPLLLPETCWIQVEVMQGPSTGRKIFLNLGQVSKIGELPVK